MGVGGYNTMTHTTKHTPGPWVVRNMSDAMAEKFTVERLSGNGLRSVICRINDMEVCPEHGGTGSDAIPVAQAARPLDPPGETTGWHWHEGPR